MAPVIGCVEGGSGSFALQVTACLSWGLLGGQESRWIYASWVSNDSKGLGSMFKVGVVPSELLSRIVHR